MRTILATIFSASVFVLFSPLEGQTIGWGNAIGEQLRDSKGAKLTKSWKFELGVFLPGFYPTEDNINEWVAHWLPLDRAELNEKVGYFSSRAPKPAPQAAGLQAYIWIYNEHKYQSQSEWLLLTDRDGNHSNDWMIPNASADPASAVVNWRISQATTVLLGDASRVATSGAGKGEDAAPRVAYSTSPIPRSALVAAASDDAKAEPTPKTIAGEIAEELVGEE